MPDPQDAGPQEPSGGFPIHANKGSGAFPEQGVQSQPTSPRRTSSSSFDGTEGVLSGGKSPHEHEHGITSSGLHRIRPQPPTRLSSGTRLPSSTHPRSAPMTIDLPRPGATIPHSSGPGTPVLTAGEYLTRFPAESLHSFSFSQKQDDFMHTRQNVLKRSMDFMRDRMGWAAGGLSIANAKAKIGGDPEMQGIMELLNRANVLGNDRTQAAGLGLSLGPLTGPAHFSQENLFEKEFTQSPTTTVERGQIDGAQTDVAQAGAVQTAGTQTKPKASDENRQVSTRFESEASPDPSAIVDEPAPSETRISKPPHRASLKRTYTDLSSVSLQNKLTQALEQSYNSEDAPIFHMPTMSSPSFPPASASGFPNALPHAHGRVAPTSQAIFTTKAENPWTITAANDLACLIFGVTKSELRRIGILDLVREDKRRWLEQKLKGARAAATPKAKASPAPSATISPITTPQRGSPSASPQRPSVMGGGVTARLLSKPPSRETARWRKTKDVDNVPVEANVNNGSAAVKEDPATSPTTPTPTSKGNKAGGVLVCGDVVSIRKRNGAFGSATLWVQENRGGLIWVMEEIAEDVAYLNVDEVGCVTKVVGSSEAVWGMERVRRGMDITRLIPDIPRVKDTNTGALDYDRIAELRRFTARTANDISVPVTVDRVSGQSSFRVSSFPHMAGMMVLSASTLQITSSNVPISEALFGRVANGLPVTDLIPNFDKMLKLLIDEDAIELVEGMVITEHSFRRARANLALQEGRPDATALFLKPTGLPAIHRDGAEIMVDVQMRVVKSNTFGPSSNERTAEAGPVDPASSSELVYALWITYSRIEHAMSHGVGPIPTTQSRPGTPPHQPMPRNSVVAMHFEDSDSDEAKSPIERRVSVLTPIPESKDSPLLKPIAKPVVKPIIKPIAKLTEAAASSSPTPPTKKSINDFVILEDMGAGAYGQVKLARPKSTNRDASPSPSGSRSPSSNNKVVIKYVTKSRILVDTWTRDRRLGTVPLEIHVLDYLRRDGFRHPNIVEMSDFFEDSVNYYIEMVPHGLPGMDLFDYIELRTSMDEEECRRIFVQVAGAVEFLHVRARVVHRDIKDENVILDGEGNIKIIDFGSASYIKNGPFDVFVGTIDYAAPEVLAGQSYAGPAQDVWALGILLYTILYKENPFYSIDEILDHELRVPHVVSEASIALVRRMLERDVERRIGIREVVADVWCRG